MRAVIQRVKSASVEVDGQLVSSIGPGLLCLIGISSSDTEKDAEFICKKLLKTKAFNGEEGGKAWEADVVAKGYELMLVSQFTLHGRLKKPKPDFSKAMPPQAAKEFYNNFVQRVRAEYGQPSRVKDGVFGAMMDVALVNAGPVTFILDSDAEGGAGGPSEQWTQPAL